MNEIRECLGESLLQLIGICCESAHSFQQIPRGPQFAVHGLQRLCVIVQQCGPLNVISAFNEIIDILIIVVTIILVLIEFVKKARIRRLLDQLQRHLRFGFGTGFVTVRQRLDLPQFLADHPRVHIMIDSDFALAVGLEQSVLILLS